MTKTDKKIQEDVTSNGELVEASRASSSKPTFFVKVYAPFQVYFEGDAYSLSAENATGPFDILPKHHNFLCMLVPCELEVVPVKVGKDSKESKPIKIKIHRALMHVEADKVSVFMDV